MLYPDLFIIYIMSIITFSLYALDKYFAVIQVHRIPEAVLLLTSFLCGAFGALCGMILFRHKTQHTSFLWCIPIFLLLQLAVDIIFRVFFI